MAKRIIIVGAGTMGQPIARGLGRVDRLYRPAMLAKEPADGLPHRASPHDDDAFGHAIPLPDISHLLITR